MCERAEAGGRTGAHNKKQEPHRKTQRCGEKGRSRHQKRKWLSSSKHRFLNHNTNTSAHLFGLKYEPYQSLSFFLICCFAWKSRDISVLNVIVPFHTTSPSLWNLWLGCWLVRTSMNQPTSGKRTPIWIWLLVDSSIYTPWFCTGILFASRTRCLCDLEECKWLSLDLDHHPKLDDCLTCMKPPASSTSKFAPGSVKSLVVQDLQVKIECPRLYRLIIFMSPMFPPLTLLFIGWWIYHFCHFDPFGWLNHTLVAVSSPYLPATSGRFFRQIPLSVL